MHGRVNSAVGTLQALAALDRSRVRRRTDAGGEAVHDGHDVDAERPRQRDDVRELQQQVDKAVSTSTRPSGLVRVVDDSPQAHTPRQQCWML